MALRALVFLDFDIDDSRASFARAAHFVETNDLKYGFSSKDVTLLGGRERCAVPEAYKLDFEWRSKGACLVQPQQNCRVVFELFLDAAPLACENFLSLVKGDRGTDKGSGVPLCYRGSPVHRSKPGFVMQGGDIVKGNGSGGASVFGKKFKDELQGLRLKHDRAGALSMGNSGKHSNSSQYFITFSPCPQLDGKHVVFGRVVSGLDVVRAVEAVGCSPEASDEQPRVPVVVTDCGLFDSSTPPAGYWAPPSYDAARGAKGRFVSPPRVFILGKAEGAAKVATSLAEANPPLRATVVNVEALADLEALLNLPALAQGIVLATPAVPEADRAASETLAQAAGAPFVFAKPAAAVEPLRPLIEDIERRLAAQP